MKFNNPNLDYYQVYVFDMDGLLLNSLDRLSSALTGCVEPDLDVDQFAHFLKYDKLNPGKSRFEKFDYAYRVILKHEKYQFKIDEALEKFKKSSLLARFESELEPSIFDACMKFPDKRFMLLSNCDETQINEVVDHHGITDVFKNNIYGTPPKKIETLKKIKKALPNQKFISISDSKSDADIAEELEMDFLYLHKFARGNIDWIKDSFYSAKELCDLL